MTAVLGRVDLTLLRARVLDDLGTPQGWERPACGDSLALAVIGALAQASVAPGAADHSVEGYRHLRLAQGADPDADGLHDLLASFTGLGGPNGWAARTGATYAAGLVETAALALLELGIDSAVDLRTAVMQDEEPLRAAWCHVPGQRSGVSWGYVRALLGLTASGPDRLVHTYLEAATARELTGAEATTLLMSTAADLGVEPFLLDHALWRFSHASRQRH